MNKKLLHGFLGSVEYLADDIKGICIFMGILSELMGSDHLFHWGSTYQHAFDEIKKYMQKYCDHHHITLSYADRAALIWMITDSSISGVSGVILQGPDHKTA